MHGPRPLPPASPRPGALERARSARTPLGSVRRADPPGAPVRHDTQALRGVGGRRAGDRRRRGRNFPEPTVGAALSRLLAIDPTVLQAAWQSTPLELRALIPARVSLWIGLCASSKTGRRRSFRCASTNQTGAIPRRPFKPSSHLLATSPLDASCRPERGCCGCCDQRAAADSAGHDVRSAAAFHLTTTLPGALDVRRLITVVS